jgi:protease I
MAELTGKRIAVLAAKGVEQVELEEPRKAVDAGKPVAAICHTPWTLLEAGTLSGRTLTSYPSIRGDLRRGGATVVDQEVCVDGNLVTSRDPDDIPAFCAAVVELFARG